MAKRVLAVDDEPDVLDLIREGLEAEGFEVETVGTATGALDLVKNQVFDAAVLDFCLPDTNGVVLHSRIRRMDPELAASTLFISGASDAAGTIANYQYESSGFLPKPFEVADLVREVRRLLGEPG